MDLIIVVSDIDETPEEELARLRKHPYSLEEAEEQVRECKATYANRPTEHNLADLNYALRVLAMTRGNCGIY